MCCEAQSVSQPVVQYSQQPQVSCSQAIPTESPSLSLTTPGPTAATMPAPSCPGMNGGVGLTGQSPSAACRSVWQTPVATILTSTSPVPGLGIGVSSITKGLPKALTIAAFIVVATFCSA